MSPEVISLDMTSQSHLNYLIVLVICFIPNWSRCWNCVDDAAGSAWIHASGRNKSSQIDRSENTCECMPGMHDDCTVAIHI